MRRSITFVAVAMLAVACCRPAAAQRYGSGDLADHLAKEGKAQVARAKKYTTSPSSKGYMPSPRPSLNFGTADDTGRFDMSGRVPPSYFKLRDPAAASSLRGYAPAARRQAPRSNAYSGASNAAAPTGRSTPHVRRPAAGYIPPPPL